MSRKWHVSEGFAMALGGVWMFVWMPLFLLICGLVDRGGMDGPVGWPGLVFLAAWFGVVLVPAAAFGLWMFVPWLWAERPRRKWQPVTTDMREAERP